MKIDLKTARVPGQASWDFLIKYLPRSLATRELMRIRALHDLGLLNKPILDVGCGDGLFWETLLSSLGEKTPSSLSGLLGIDISVDELKLASIRLEERGGRVLNRDISASEGVDEFTKFSTVIANCSLEHVSRIEPALANIHKMMSDDSRFILFVPAPRWSETLWCVKALKRFSHRLSGMLGGCFDGFFQHRHLYSAPVWEFLLAGIGFKVDRIAGLGSAICSHTFERHLPTALLAFVWKSIFKRYPQALIHGVNRLRPIPKALLSDIESGRMLLTDLTDPEIVEYFIVCRKLGVDDRRVSSPEEKSSLRRS